MKKTKKPKVVMVGNTPITPVRAKEQREIKKRIEKRHEQLRRRYPEVHGKVVDFISHSVADGNQIATDSLKGRRAKRSSIYG
jgi:phage terminase Nu1 subunit (DNA packaging protein)